MSEPCVVLHVLNGATGGAAESTKGLMHALRARGIRSAAVVNDMGSPADVASLREAADGALVQVPLYHWNRRIRSARWKRPLVELRDLARSGFLARSTATILAAARRHRATLIHTNTLLTPEGALASRIANLPHVWHVRELVGSGAPFRLPIEGPAFGWLTLGFSDAFIANSRVTGARLAGWVPAERLHVVPNGVDISRFRPRDEPGSTRAPGGASRVEEPPAELGRPLVVAMMGNATSQWKKHALFIEAAARARRVLGDAPAIEFRLLGHAPDGDAYVRGLHRRVDELGLRSCFSFAGFVSDAPQAFGEIDVLVHPADGESFGRIAIEAMASGVPVVGPSEGGIGEVVVDGETGLLVPKDDAARFADAIVRLARDSRLRRRFGTNGRVHVEARYSLDAHTARVVEIYRRVIESRRPVTHPNGADPHTNAYGRGEA